MNKKGAEMPLFYYVPRTGLEPVTLCLEGRCSIQLSYRGIQTFSINSQERCWKLPVRLLAGATGVFMLK